jgi:alkanesulfonate monooxygenase SsuD/methylene tetrahydromethanopterin reductase-like flavin-dependent oxidoreductase (luciferase family)
MDIGIGLPATIPGVEGKQLTEWARKADEAGFSTLGTLDRIVYPNFEPLIALASAAAVTERIRLTTSIAILPYRQSAALVAKQVATIHALSGGRMVLGAAVGGREDDYEAAGSAFHDRGKRFEAMLEEIELIWQGDRGIGPKLEPPPPILIGGRADVTYRRAARYGAGWLQGGGTPDQLAEGKEKTEAAFRDAGRDEAPRIAGLFYYALGDAAEEAADRYLKDYYAYLGEGAEQVASSAATDAETVEQYLQSFEQAGCDEMICFPCSPDPEQVDLLAEVALH